MSRARKLYSDILIRYKIVRNDNGERGVRRREPGKGVQQINIVGSRDVVASRRRLWQTFFHTYTPPTDTKSRSRQTVRFTFTKRICVINRLSSQRIHVAVVFVRQQNSRRGDT